MGEKRNAYLVLDRKPEDKGILKGTRSRRENNNKITLEETGLDLSGLGQGSGTGRCEQGDKPQDFIKGEVSFN
jgi:hypothetical protein